MNAPIFKCHAALFLRSQVTDALEQAVGRESPPDDFSLVFRDDQGSQYTPRAFQRRLEPHGIAQSMSRPGSP